MSADLMDGDQSGAARQGPARPGTARPSAAWPGRAKWRPTLATRITIAFVAVAVGVAAVTTAALLWNARTIILESKQEAIFDTFSTSAKLALSELPASPNANELAAVLGRFSETTLLINLDTQAVSDAVLLDFAPEMVFVSITEGHEATAFERTNRYGNLIFFVGLSMKSGVDRDGDKIAVFSEFNMQDQQDEIDSLVGLAALLGLIIVAAAAVVGLVVGRQLGRPLRNLVAVAGGLGRRENPPSIDTVYPDVNAVLEAMRRSAAELDATIRELEQSEATARRLVADVAHELRTPLATIVAVSDILSDTESATPRERSAAGQIVARSGAHLTALINDILEMSRFDSGRAEVRIEPVDLEQLWDELALLRQWDSSVACELSDGLGGFSRAGEADELGVPGGSARLVVSTDPRRLKVILSNLVTNALRHGAPPVEVRMAVEGARLSISVSDAGAGVPVQHAPHIFDRFYKAGAARESSESSGLGLAIVRENARILGGEAWLEDGSTFRVRIPLAPASKPHPSAA